MACYIGVTCPWSWIVAPFIFCGSFIFKEIYDTFLFLAKIKCVYVRKAIAALSVYLEKNHPIDMRCVKTYLRSLNMINAE